ncbi:MAG TPA: hypothetical protein VGK31_13710 [Thermoanaerobaculia bacterium]|jgi:hypothetical protein
MLERYTHPTLERRIAALDTFDLSTKRPQNSVQQKEAAEAASFVRNFGLPLEARVALSGLSTFAAVLRSAATVDTLRVQS